MAGEKLVRRALEAIRQPAATPREGIRAYHSSPHDFDRFDLSKIGTGEGNQAYGHGLYVAESPKVSGQGGDYWRQFWNKMPSGPERSAATALFANKFDRDKAIDHLLRDVDYNSVRGIPGKYGDGPDVEEGHRLLAQEAQQALDILKSGQIAGPRTYEVNINARPEQFLDYDKPLAQQSDSVQKALRSIDIADESVWPRISGHDAYEMLRVDSMGDDAFLRDQAYRLARRADAGAGASTILREAGIPGIKYFDAGSRDAGEGTRNYVVFDDRLIDIMKKYGLPMMTAGAGAASMADQPGSAMEPGAEEPREGFQKGGRLISEALDLIRKLPPAENSRLTQIATTGPSYRKALSHLERAGIEGRAIDYGAGRGHGLREIGADTFEPYPQGWSPTYTKPEEIPDEVYRRLVNLNVLNVLDPQARESAVLNMGRIVEPGGGGVISTRGRDVMSARGEPGPEPMSLIIGEGDQARYQKGFTPRELREYVGDTLGSRFDVEPSDVGQASIMFRRNREDGGLVPQQDAEDPRDDFDRGGTVAKALRTVRQMMERSQDLPAEQRMMVVHKTRLPALEQYERLGGLPVPSTAVVKTGEPLTNFGDVTLVGNPEILAKPSERNPIFASDVYSPRMPDIQGDKKQFFETYNRYGEPTRRPATIGSLVSNMRGNVRGGENFGATEGAVRAQITPQFRSVAELDAARGRLSQAAYDEARAAMRGRGDELFARIGDLSRNPRIMDFYGDMEGVARILRQYGNQGAEPLAAYMSKRYNVGNDEMADVIRYVRDLRDMPSPYFEGKPQRAVPFTDFSGALIPEGRTARDTADLLNRQGVRNIEFYSPKQDLGGGEAERALSDALIERFPQQQFADGGAVDYNDAPNYALDAETSRFNMGDVFPSRTRGLSQGKNPVRAENIPLARPVAPPEPDVVSRALNVVRAEPRPMDIKVSRQAPPFPRPVPRPAPRPAPAPAQAAPDTSESRRLWEIYNETGNPADFVRASNAMRAGRADGGEAPPTTPDQRLDVVNTYLEDVVDQSLNRTPMAPFNRISEPATPAPFTTPEERINVLRTYFGDVADQRHNRSLTPVVEEAPRARSVADPNRQSYLEAFGPPQTSAGLTANTPAPLAPGEYGRQKLDRMMTNIFGPNARERAISAARNVFAPPSPYLSPGEYGRHRLDAIINNLIDPSLLGSKATLGVEDIRGGVVLPDRAGSAPPPSDYRMEPSRPAIQEQAPAPAPTASMPVQAEAKANRFSDDDVEALANMIAGEASTQGREGMAQVGQVALNRAMMNYNNYGDTLQAQLSRPRQFAGYNSPTAKAIMAGGTPQQQAIAQQAREIARGLIDGTIQPKFANATDFNRGSPSFNAKRGAANAERLGTHTFFNASPAYAKRLERARREREGRATGGIVDDALNVVRELPQEDRVRVAMFAGEGAVGAPLQSLDVAKQLLAKGATPEEAYRGSSSDGATGWFQGADGRWRFEISDKDAALNQESFERLRAGESVRPEQLFQHPRLFEMYPHLNEIQLGLVPQDQYDDGLIGSFNPRTNTLSLPPDPAKAHSNMLHELQHSIQEHERFGAGGDSDQIKRALKAEAVLEQLRARNRIVDMMREGENRMFDTNYRDPEQVSRLREFQKENERRISGERGLIPPLEQRVNDLAPTGRWGSLKDYELYRRLAGETEARNVQNRMMMDLEERRSSFPGATQEYPNEEQYIRLRGERAEGGEVRDGYDKGGVVKKALKAVADLFGTPEMEKWRGKSVIPSSRVEDRYFTGTSKDKDFANFNVGRHGVWLTKDPAEASMYALQNDSMGYRFGSGGVERTNTASRVIPVFARADNPYTGQLPDFTMNPNYKRAQSEWFDQLRSQGHDAWLPENNPNLAVILRDPEQIKSAISNTGEFSGPRIDRADGGRLLEDEYPTHYLPNVGRQVMADGGEPTAQSRRRATLEQLGSFEDRPPMDPAVMGQNWANAVQRFRDRPLREGEATVRPLELGARDVIGGAIAGDGGITRGRLADIVVGSRGLPGSGTLGMGVADLTPAGIPLAISDFSDALRNEDYLSAGLSAALPAAYYARKPIMAAGRAVYDAGARAVDTARDVLGRVPAPVAAGGAGAAVMTPEEAEAAKLDAAVRAARKAASAAPSRPDLFDYSRLGDVPHVRQFDLPRNDPARGVPSRVVELMQNQNVRDEMLKTIEQGNVMGGSRWYNADPLRDQFVAQFGRERGDEAFRKYMDFVAATSPRSEVGSNVRNASYYYNRAMTGQGMPAVGDRNPQPYGHMAQRLHQINAERVSGAGWDPLNNPKPASFVENLVGNQQPVTVDTHAFRLPAIIARDPRFLETAFQVDKTAPKQNIAKMIESGEISMDDAAGRAAYWQAQPKPNEYAAMEQYYKSLGRDLGLTPAQTQAAAWVGGGARTGLKSDESKPFLRFVEDRIYKTAEERNMDPQDVMRLFVRGEMPLYASGGAVADRAIDLAKELGSSPRETVKS